MDGSKRCCGMFSGPRKLVVVCFLRRRATSSCATGVLCMAYRNQYDICIRGWVIYTSTRTAKKIFHVS